MEFRDFLLGLQFAIMNNFFCTKKFMQSKFNEILMHFSNAERYLIQNNYTKLNNILKDLSYELLKLSKRKNICTIYSNSFLAIVIFKINIIKNRFKEKDNV